MTSLRHRDPRTGFSLIEVLITLVLLGILVVMAVGLFRELREKYAVEAETKRLYADLMDARGRALQRNRMFFVRFSADGYGYATYEDTSTAPDGNQAFDAGADSVAASATFLHPIVLTLTTGGTSFAFDRNAVASTTGTIRLSSAVQADYDCITVRETRIRMGQYTGGNCVEK